VSRPRTVPGRAMTPLIVLLLASPASAALTEAPRLAAVYDTILAARFDRVEAQLKQACPPAPAEACAALGVVSLWWQILIEPESRRLDTQFNDRAQAAVAASDAWTKREPQRAEAWFYLAGAYAPLVQWRVLRGERLAAARDAKRIKDALERALQLDPGLDDAHFGIGAYHYYADVAPAAAKVLRWLLLLPGGDRVKGLQEMLQARQHGVLLGGEADYQLHVIYLWYEQQPRRAVELLRELDARYPSNPLFQQRIAEVQDVWLHDRSASEAGWQILLDRAHEGRVDNPPRTEGRARLGLARLAASRGDNARAREQLEALLAARGAPPIVLASAYVEYARLLERAGDRTRAIDNYRRAAEVNGGEAHARDDARAALKRLGAS
jgi:tetratricopeptide (TPR) repeat protein